METSSDLEAKGRAMKTEERGNALQRRKTHREKANRGEARKTDTAKNAYKPTVTLSMQTCGGRSPRTQKHMRCEGTLKIQGVVQGRAQWIKCLLLEYEDMSTDP